MQPAPLAPSGLTDLARLLASPARATMLLALLEGRPLAAGELSHGAGIATSTASEHLTALTNGGLVTSLRSGRHRYYRLTGPDVAETLEAWFRQAPPPAPRSLRESNEARRLAFARTCYDHVAGTVGVAMHAAMLDRAWLTPTTDGYDVTPAGEFGLRAMCVDLDAARLGRRTFARPCLDWTERRHHLAGALAAEVCRAMTEHQWLRRGRNRGIELTGAGSEGLAQSLGVVLESGPAGRPAEPARSAVPAPAATHHANAAGGP
jgi:DNA-binding transcriptional ArsR family regulator